MEMKMKTNDHALKSFQYRFIYLLVGLYWASICTVSVGLHSSNIACSAVTEVKSTPLS